jgi:hypothetical protein
MDTCSVCHEPVTNWAQFMFSFFLRKLNWAQFSFGRLLFLHLFWRPIVILPIPFSALWFYPCFLNPKPPFAPVIDSVSWMLDKWMKVKKGATNPWTYPNPPSFRWWLTKHVRLVKLRLKYLQILFFFSKMLSKYLMLKSMFSDRIIESSCLTTDQTTNRD